MILETPRQRQAPATGLNHGLDPDHRHSLPRYISIEHSRVSPHVVQKAPERSATPTQNEPNGGSFPGATSLAVSVADEAERDARTKQATQQDAVPKRITVSSNLSNLLARYFNGTALQEQLQARRTHVHEFAYRFRSCVIDH